MINLLYIRECHLKAVLAKKKSGLNKGNSISGGFADSPWEIQNTQLSYNLLKVNPR